jgi:hypothetical protein
MIEGTVAAWIDALTFNRVWDEERDTWRIRESFGRLVANAERWPPPVEFTRNLPPSEERPALPSKPVSDDVAQANIRECMRLLYGKRDDE